MQFDIENTEHRNKLTCEVVFYTMNREKNFIKTEKHIAEYANEINSVYNKMTDILENAYNKTKIKQKEYLTLVDMLKDTAEYKLNKYPQITERVNDGKKNITRLQTNKCAIW